MSDTLANALSSASRSSTVLQGIANPPQVNPLAGMGTAMEMVGRMQGLDKSLSERTLGEAYAKAVDPKTGVFDPLAANRNAAADPRTAYAMKAGVESSQQLQGAQLEQARARAEYVNRIAGSLTRLGPNITQEAVLGALNTAVTDGVLDPATHQRLTGEVSTLGNDPLKLHTWASQREYNAMSMAQQLERKYGTRQTITAGGDTFNIPVPAPGADGPTISITHSNDPNATVETEVMIDRNGSVTTDPSAAVSTQKRRVPVSAVPGTPGQGTTSPQYTTPGGGSTTSSPFPNGGRNSPLRKQGGGGGQQQPQQPEQQPQQQPQQPQPQQPQQPQNPSLTASAPTGVEERLKADREAYRAAQERQPVLQRQAQNLGQALDLLKILSTGKTTEATNALFNALGALNLLPAGAKRDVANYEEYRKLAEMAVIDAAGSGTDMAKQMQRNANPGTGLSTPANFELSRIGLGRTLQEIAIYKAYEADNPGLGGPGMKKHIADAVANTDPRGFVWDSYSQPEQARILASVKDDKVADDMLHRAIGMRKKLDIQIPRLTPPAAPRPGGQSALTPPAPNLMAMNGSSPNALMAG